MTVGPISIHLMINWLLAVLCCFGSKGRLHGQKWSNLILLDQLLTYKMTSYHKPVSKTLHTHRGESIRWVREWRLITNQSVKHCTHIEARVFGEWENDCYHQPVSKTLHTHRGESIWWVREWRLTTNQSVKYCTHIEVRVFGEWENDVLPPTSQ